VITNAGSAVDLGLRPGAVYSHALFTRETRGWIGPVAMTVGTVSRDPTVAAYVAPPSTVIVSATDGDKPTVTAGGVSVQLAAGRATPVIGAGFVLPVSPTLPAGYLGQVTSVSADGRSVSLIPAGLADAFDYYKINVDLGTIPPSDLQPVGNQRSVRVYQALSLAPREGNAETSAATRASSSTQVSSQVVTSPA
jgi:hypothetical protein